MFHPTSCLLRENARLTARTAAWLTTIVQQNAALALLAEDDDNTVDRATLPRTFTADPHTPYDDDAATTADRDFLTPLDSTRREHVKLLRQIVAVALQVVEQVRLDGAEKADPLIMCRNRRCLASDLRHTLTTRCGPTSS